MATDLVRSSSNLTVAAEWKTMLTSDLMISSCSGSRPSLSSTMSPLTAATLFRRVSSSFLILKCLFVQFPASGNVNINLTC